MLHRVPLVAAATFCAPAVAVLQTPPFDPFEAAFRSSIADVTFVAVSRTLSRQWAGPGLTPLVIDNGIALARFRFQAVPEAPLQALWVGCIVPEKGFHLAIDAARMAAVPLWIAGPVRDRRYWADEIIPRLGADAAHI